MPGCSSIYEIAREAGKIVGHNPEYVNESGHLDQIVCSCGWESTTFNDGVEYAWDQWASHARPFVEKTHPELVEKMSGLM